MTFNQLNPRSADPKRPRRESNPRNTDGSPQPDHRTIQGQMTQRRNRTTQPAFASRPAETPNEWPRNQLPQPVDPVHMKEPHACMNMGFRKSGVT